jgi:hypothetical protein
MTFPSTIRPELHLSTPRNKHLSCRPVLGTDSCSLKPSFLFSLTLLQLDSLAPIQPKCPPGSHPGLRSHYMQDYASQRRYVAICTGSVYMGSSSGSCRGITSQCGRVLGETSPWAPAQQRGEEVGGDSGDIAKNTTSFVKFVHDGQRTGVLLVHRNVVIRMNASALAIHLSS